MITLAETASGLYGAWRLAHADRTGMAYFDRTPRGAVRSFYAALIAAPGFALITLIDLSGHPPSASWPTILIVEIIGYVISWTALPAAVFELSRLVGRGERFVDFLVAYNWCFVLQVAFFLPVAALAASGLVPENLSSAGLMATYILLLIYEGYIARVSLDVTIALAVAVVGLDICLSYLIDAAISAILR